MRKAIASVLCVAAIATACTAQPTPAVWLNASFDELRTAFGDPTGVFINPTGNRVYAFSLPRREDIAHNDETPLVYGNAELILQGVDCIVTFELAQAYVSRWNWNETGCAKLQLPLPYETGAIGPGRR